MGSKAEMLKYVRATLFADLDKRYMKCSECDQRFWLKSRLEKHRLIHKYCNICYEMFTDKMELTHHLFSHYQLEAGPCPVCHDLYPDEDELLQHLRMVHIQYLRAKDQALLEKYPHSMSSSRFTQFDIPEVLDFNDSVPVPLKNSNILLPNPPTDVKENVAQQIDKGIKRTSSSESFVPSKQSKQVQRHVSSESSCPDLVISNSQNPVSLSSKKNNLRNRPHFRQSPFYFPFKVTYKLSKKSKNSLPNVNNSLTEAERMEAWYDTLIRGSTEQNISSNAVAKSEIIKQKEVKSLMPSNIQLQKVPIISTPTARLPKVIIGETLNNFQNSPKSIDTLVPVNSDLNVLHHSLSNRKIVKVSPECMKVLKESLLKDSPAANSKHVCVKVPPKMLKQLELLPAKSELKKESESVSRTPITTIMEIKKSNVPNIEELLREDKRRKDEKEKIKKKEKIVRKMIMKYEEKEEKKLLKYFQKIVASLIKKKQGNLNRIEKMLADTARNKSKLLDVIRQLNCRDQNDVGQLLEYFGMKFPHKNSITGDKETVCGRGGKVVKKGKPVKSSSVSKIEQKGGISWKGRISMGQKYVKNMKSSVSNDIPGQKSVKEEKIPEKTYNNFSDDPVASTFERNMTPKSENSYLFKNFNSHKIPFGEDLFTDMSIITEETYTIACPCGEEYCMGIHSDSILSNFLKTNNFCTYTKKG